MNIHPTRTKTDYKRAQRGVSADFDNEPEQAARRATASKVWPR